MCSITALHYSARAHTHTHTYHTNTQLRYTHTHHNTHKPIYSYPCSADCDITSGLSGDMKTYFRKHIINAILATDMSSHQELTRAVSLELNADSYSASNEEHRALLGHALLHASDLSNPTLDFDLAEQWRVLLMAGEDRVCHGMAVVSVLLLQCAARIYIYNTVGTYNPKPSTSRGTS